MPSAFISYAHEDQEYVLALVPQLQAEGLDITYDRVALHIGDSLIRAISQEIADGDFLIAIVSPSSVDSEWCQTELALAKTQGVNEQRVKVLPVKYRGADMPSMLGDTFWGDADTDDVTTIARKLGAAMTAHIQGGTEEASAEAAEAVPHGGSGHTERARADASVDEVEAVADKVWDLLAQWDRCHMGAPTSELTDKQRRLRWLLESLPEVLQVGLPLVQRLSTATWDDYFRLVRPDDAEPDLREEMRSVRAQVEQGLPITRRWTVDVEVLRHGQASDRDAWVYVWTIRRDEEARTIGVYVSGPAMEIENEYLPQEVARAKETLGRSVVTGLLALDDPPRDVMVTTAGVSLSLPD
jgi:hypothetical protein